MRRGEIDQPAPPWWEKDRSQIADRRLDPSVPGGVILTARDRTITVPPGAGSFTIKVPSPGQVGLVVVPNTEPIGVVVTGDRSELTLAPATTDPDELEVDLRVVGRPTNDTAASLMLRTQGPTTVTHLAVDSATATTEFPVAEISLRHASYICRGNRNPPTPRVEANGECTIDIDAEFELAVESGSRLTVRGRSDVAMLRTGEGVVVVLAASGNPTNEAHFILGNNEGSVRIEENAGTFRIGGRCNDIEVVGDGWVDVMQDARVVGLALTPGSNVPKLSLGPRATAEQVTGVVQLGQCRHARIAGSPDKPLIVEAVIGNGTPWSEAILSGIRLPGGIQGVPVLLAAREASIFDPNLTELPAHRAPYNRWLRGPATKGVDEHVLVNDSSHADLLAQVTAERSTQGSIRTRSAHASYRMRQLAASSRWERWLLAAYRPFGYAQRPGPPLALWLVATALAIPLVTISGRIDPIGWAEWLELCGEVLFLPFSFLRLNEGVGSELSKLTAVLLVALRVVLTVPFIFAVLAIRQFVRGGDR